MREIHVGDVIGKYEIIRKLGSGGMSVVWLAMDPTLNKTWAIKEVKKNASAQQYRVNVEQTRKEAFIMRDLNHPALPHINEIIEDRDTLFVVMEYVPGKNLADILKERGRAFDEEAVIDWGIQLCDALSYLHTLDPPIIYRDMKPSNVILQDDGSVRIIDFGIAKEVREGEDTIVAGTPKYAPPEAMSADTKTDQRSDVYSLGVTLFNLVTGEPPSHFAVLPPIRDINPALSPSLEHTIAVAIRQDPNRRWQSCNEMRYELENPEDPVIIKRFKRLWAAFKGLCIAAGVCLLLGIGCLVASNLVAGSSYDGLMSRASVSDTAERGANNDASEAEELYTQAIDIMPGNIEPYSNLVNQVYKADSAFTTSEANRWSLLYSANENSINRASGYAKLCYDVGIDYFLYYAYGDELARGSQAVIWFDRALNANDQAGGTALSGTEARSANAYRVIGNFSAGLQQATTEGREGDSYNSYFEAFETAIYDNEVQNDETIVQLRLYNVVVEALKSPDYVSGFSRAGISQTRLNNMLDAIETQTTALTNSASNSGTTAGLYQDIMNGIPDAESVINNVYNSVGVRKGGAASEGEGA